MTKQEILDRVEQCRSGLTHVALASITYHRLDALADDINADIERAGPSTQRLEDALARLKIVSEKLQRVCCHRDELIERISTRKEYPSNVPVAWGSIGNWNTIIDTDPRYP